MNLFLNVIWFCLVGWELAALLLALGLFLCVTILGIPLGLKCFGIIPLVLFPFGRQNETKR